MVKDDYYNNDEDAPCNQIEEEEIDNSDYYYELEREQNDH